MRYVPAATSDRGARAKRALVLFFIVGVCWVPGGVTLAMLLTGNA